MSVEENFLNWQTKAQKELGCRDLSLLTKESLEELLIKPLYTSMDITPNDEWPGEFPYKRGIKATMYSNRPWTIRQYAGFSTAEESNAFYKECLKNGQKGLSIAFDLPTHRGYDSDHPKVLADVGQAGVAIDSVEDMKILFNGIDLGEVSVSMTMNGAVLPIFAAFIVAAEEFNIKKEKLSGTIQNDILKEFMVRNTFIYPPKPSMRIVGDIISYGAQNLPKFNTISISGYHIHEAGADLALELALTLSNGLEYVKCALNKGLKVDDFAPRLSFFFATGMNFFMEVAKLRAARKLWGHLMKDFAPQNPQSLQLRTHCQTSGWSLSALDPYNNIIRTTIEALASVLGGTQSLHTNSFDEALGLPSKFSAKLARNTQLILQHESKICDVIDPLGGSYYVEYLTEELIKKAKKVMKRIDDLGGMIKAIEMGIPQKWIEESASKRQALIDSKKELVVGVNTFFSDDEEQVDVRDIDTREVLKKQKIRLKTLKENRNQDNVNKALSALKSAAALNNGNLLALSIDAMRHRATLGEVSECLSEVFHRYEPLVTVVQGVYKKAYGFDKKIEEIIKEIENFSKKNGRRPRILVAKLGQDGHDRGAKVIASSFADFGFDVDLSGLFQDPKIIVKEAIDNDVHIIGVSTLAAGHKTLIPLLMDELKEKNAQDILVVVGGVIPPKDHNLLYKAGVHKIFGPGTNIVDAALEILAGLKK